MTFSIFYSTRTLEWFFWGVLLLAAAAAWVWPRHRGLHMTQFRFRRFSRKRWPAIIAVGLFPMTARLLLLPVFPFPSPKVHDEFSNLLLGDTLAHGRLANPTPAYWQHFETEYELLRPTYASQYEPGQGLVLAAGQVLFGHPWWGVWFSTGVMCGALCWALGSFLPPGWAMFAGILAALQFGIYGFWMNSYFGGAVPAIGGALVFGSLARRDSAGLSAVRGLGLILVFATRPVEALIWSVPVAWVEIRAVVRRNSTAVAFLLVFGIGAGALGYYNQRVTGNPAEPPYLTYRRAYGTPQSYWWQPAVIVSNFHYPQLEANYQDQLRYWERRYSVTALWNASWRRLRDFWRFFAGPLLTPAVLFFLFTRKRRKLLPWIGLSIVFILDHATYHAWYPQQSASETVLIVLFLVEGWRQLRAWRRSQRLGLALSHNLISGFALALVFLSAGLYVKAAVPTFASGPRSIWAGLIPAPSSRDRAIEALGRIPGKHLVFVQYGANHPWYDDWVFNGADIPGSRIVFARMWTPESDLALARSMSGRDVWIANPEATPPLVRVTPGQLLVAWSGRQPPGGAYSHGLGELR